MSRFGWGVDGYGRAHIVDESKNEVVLCMIDGCGKIGVLILEDQDKSMKLNGEKPNDASTIHPIKRP